MEFLELVESIEQKAADTKKIFEGDGRGVRNLSKAHKQQADYNQKLAEAARLIADVRSGKKPSYLLQEAMTTSDFPLLFGDILDRQLLAGYRATPATFEAYTRVTTVRDFRQVSRKYVDGGDGVLDPVSEQEEYKYGSIDEGEYKYSVKKYGRKFDFSWETMINDDLDALADMPQRLGRAARRSEEKFVTELFVDANGPHASLYTAGQGNLLSGNPVLSIDSLQAAFTAMSTLMDPSSGEPIWNQPRYLVVPPALEVTARNILNGMELRLNENGGTSNQQLVTANWMRNNLQLVVNYYIPVVASTANGSTSWFLFADPNDGRGAMEFGRLRGHTEPEVFMKAANAMMVGGGGQIDPMNGDFDTDSIEYKVRHVFGGTRLDWRYTVASNGSGS